MQKNFSVKASLNYQVRHFLRQKKLVEIISLITNLQKKSKFRIPRIPISTNWNPTENSSILNTNGWTPWTLFRKIQMLPKYSPTKSPTQELNKSFMTAFCFLQLLQTDTTSPGAQDNMCLSSSSHGTEFKMSAGTCSLYRLSGESFIVLLLVVLEFPGICPISFIVLMFLLVLLSPIPMRISAIGVGLT